MPIPKETVTIPVFCAECGQPVCVKYFPVSSQEKSAPIVNGFVCPHCGKSNRIELHGVFMASWAGHGPEPAPAAQGVSK
jgi:hypothetical protein